MAGREPKAAPPAARRRAAAYLRMSTDEQAHSLANQAAAIAAYAQSEGYDVVRAYEDAGVSGKSTQGRTAFKALLATILGGQADFEAVLVYDVSRWGRFQDPDEAGHYEYLCLQEGVRVVYCAEGFGEAAEAGHALLKGLKRAMAAEYSRELGRKVGQAQARRSAQGHWQHGRPGYGLRRQLTTAEGEPVRLLKDGERKSDPRLHTVLVLGPMRERRTVRWIHQRFQAGRDMPAIARELNQAGEPAEAGAPWTPVRVGQVLTNPKYMGDLVTRRRVIGADGRRALRSADDWVTAKGACPALVSRKVFAATQAALAALEPPSDSALLDQLRTLAATHGMLGDKRLYALGVPHVRAYRARFGTLRAAYALIGVQPPRSFPKRWSDQAMLQGLAALYLREGALNLERIDADGTIPSGEAYRKRFGSLFEAYARIGYVNLTPADLASPVGQARAAALRARLERWVREPSPAGEETAVG